MFWIGLLVGMIGYCIWLIGRCFFRVDQGYLAVLISFRAALTDPKDPERLRTYGAGLHVKWPWQKAQRVPMMEQSLDLSGEKGRTAMAEDGTVLRFDSILRFEPVEAELANFLFDLQSPREHITGLFTCLLRNEIADFRPTASDSDGRGNGRRSSPLLLAAGDNAHSGGSYGLIRRQRHELSTRIEEFCRTEIGKRYGVRFSAVDLTDILPPDELADALNAVMNAQAEADGLYALAEAESHQRVVAAERGVAIARARAAATEKEIAALEIFLIELHRGATLAQYVARRRAEVLSQSRTLYLRSVG